ncbi:MULTISPECIES: response regulator transcription factor [Oxalobacteraceae]|uniref:Response regulator n=1 Tax=Herminiimonas contaminans TaxID=1111140 RepID=A0ABS0ESD0_9BURK|nr:MULTISPECIES: response regulator [Oxalobacteraceae]MBF8177750.1 response regulator [Herminiimonas contaminans]
MSLAYTPWNIAVVEDDNGLRAAILRMLTACGWKPIGYASAEGYLESAPGEDIDCLVLDLYLPGMSGFELLEQIRSTGKDIPIIFITAQDDEKIRLRVQGVGKLYLPKPFTGQSLAMKVRDCLKQTDLL